MFSSNSNFCLRGPFFHGSYSFYRLFQKVPQSNRHQLRRENVILQTPQVSIGNLGNKTVTVSLDNLYASNSCRDLVASLKLLEGNLQNTSQHLNPSYKSSLFKSSITTWMNTNYLRFSLLPAGIKVFNREQSEISEKFLTNGTLAKIRYWIKGIRQYSDCWKLELVALQVKVYDPTPVPRCLIEDDVLLPSPSNKSSEYAKFKTMISMGVPRMAVEQKCRLAGLDPKLIDGDGSNKPTNTRPTNPLQNSINNAICGGVKLKSSILNNKKGKPPKKPKKSTNQLIPTLDDILNQLNSLRSTGVTKS